MRICVLDTAVYRHAAFDGYDIHGLEENTGPVDGPGMAGHGTFGVGLILKQAPAATVICHPVLDQDGSGDLWGVAQKMMELERTGELRADILHLPWGCLTRDGKAPYVLAAAVTKLHRPDRVIVAAAGNHGDSVDPAVPQSAPSYPAALPEARAVGASGPRQELTDYTPKPRSAPWIDVAELGDRVRSTYLGNGFAQWSGTSFAAARFTGMLAAGAANGTGTGESSGLGSEPESGAVTTKRDIAEEAKQLVDRWRHQYDEDYR